MHDYLKSGRQAVRLLYYLVAGFAITKAVSIVFDPTITGGKFELTRLLMFIVFFSFISRFFLGAYRVLSYDIDIEVKRGKIVTDLIVLFVQALAFYVFALNISDIKYSQWIIIIICGLDLLWLILLASLFQITERAASSWMVLNLITVFALCINIYALNNNIYILLIISIIAMIVDFVYNNEFYFSLRYSPHLRIFVAGPYGDTETHDVIAANVEKAKQVGKELALKGHYPLIPHTMLHGWEMNDRFTLKNFTDIDDAWLEFCDALFFIAESEGANREKERATRKGLQIFTQLDRVPDATKRIKDKF